MLTIDASEAIAVLNGMAARMADPKPVLAQIGEFTASKVMLGIMSEKDSPDGRAWAEWRPTTRHEREEKGNVGLGLLWDEGTLLGSIRVQTTLREVVVGTTLPYGKWLQEGTKKKDGTVHMAARPWLGWSDAEAEMAAQFIANYIEGVGL